MSQPRVREFVERHKVEFLYTQPQGEATDYTVEAWAGGELVAMATDPKVDDALLAVLDRVADEMRSDEDDTSGTG